MMLNLTQFIPNFRTHITKKHKAEISKQLPTVEDLSCANAELEQCDICEVKCASAGELQMHKELQHSENTSGGVVEYSCDQCEYKTRNRRRLPEHIRQAEVEK